MSWRASEQDSARELIRLALQEDLDPGSASWGRHEDATSQALIPPDLLGSALFVARVPCVLAGSPILPLVFEAIDARIQVEILAGDGQKLSPSTTIARVRGPMRGLLLGERTALNFLQRLSGIATWTARHVEEIQDLPTVLLDTRKTTPGWRFLEKYAVRMGGGTNHRMSLADGILVKDNHLAALSGRERSTPEMAAHGAQLARRWADEHGGMSVEIEIDGLDQLEPVLNQNPDIVLLDNFSIPQLSEAVAIRNRVGSRTLLEASGGIRLETLRAVALTGVERISVGALVHQARSIDLAMDYQVS